MATIKQLSQLRNFERMFNPEMITYAVAQALAEEGKKLIVEAYESRMWQNRTHNLRYSFVSFVVANGKLIEGTERFLDDSNESEEPLSTTTRPKNYGEDEDGGFALTGRDEAKNFIKSYVSKHTNEKGVHLVVAAAMYYASILEKHLGFDVISHIEYSLPRVLQNIKTLKYTPYRGAHHTLEIKGLKGVARRVNDVAEGARTFRFK